MESLTPNKAAEKVNVSANTIRKFIRNGRLPATSAHDPVQKRNVLKIKIDDLFAVFPVKTPATVISDEERILELEQQLAYQKNLVNQLKQENQALKPPRNFMPAEIANERHQNPYYLMNAVLNAIYLKLGLKDDRNLETLHEYMNAMQLTYYLNYFKQIGEWYVAGDISLTVFQDIGDAHQNQVQGHFTISANQHH